MLVHRNDTEDAPPKRFSMRYLSVYKKALLDATLHETIYTSVVRKSRRHWAFPIVLAPNNDGTALLRVNFRELNLISVRDSYLFPSFGSILYPMATASAFTTLDCTRELSFLKYRFVGKTSFTEYNRNIY